MAMLLPFFTTEAQTAQGILELRAASTAPFASEFVGASLGSPAGHAAYIYGRAKAAPTIVISVYSVYSVAKNLCALCDLCG